MPRLINNQNLDHRIQTLLGACLLEHTPLLPRLHFEWFLADLHPEPLRHIQWWRISLELLKDYFVLEMSPSATYGCSTRSPRS
jgi:hypothetical protein